MKEKLFFIFILIIPIFASSQNAIIGGIVNSYAAGIQQISPYQLQLSQTSSFNVNDTVFVYQAQGAIPDLTNNSSFGDIQNLANAGNYDFSIIQSIDNINKIITLSCPLTNNYDGNLFQVVKVKTYTNATVNSTLTCYPWDGSKGGVLVLFVNGTLTLNANIDVLGKGFRGANSPYINSLNKCSNEATGGIYRYFYTANGYDSAGLKGESIVLLPFNYARGRGKIANGGGGGNGINSAGGGGSHAGMGGNGGRESDACSFVYQNYGGIGGQSIYDGVNVDAQKLFFGGGGGTGTFEQYATDVSRGGNGGGIAIIVASNIVANNHQITADGESVFYTTTYESAGGGGGGGTIVVSSQNLNGNITLSSKGGDGGSSYTTSCRGSGGGGGGGVIYHSMTSGPVLNVSQGIAGTACNGYSGTNGTDGITSSIFNFSFNCLSSNNIIQANQHICPGFQPNLLTGSSSPLFISYEWQCSTDSSPWQPCSGVNNQANYQPDTLSQTTYFRRIVFYNTVLSDTSNVVTIHVNPLTTDTNVIPVSCYGGNNGSVSVSAIGGSGIYSYVWNNGNTTDSINNLYAGVYYVTVSDHMGCSIIDTVTIHQPPLLSLSFNKTDVLCNGGSNGTATVNPSGGVPSYTYSWSNGLNTQTITGLSANIYNVTVYDSNGCSANNSVTILQPQPITLNTTVTNATCSYLCNGSITLNVSGGTSPYTINPSNLYDLCPGNYVITVTDANNCTFTTTKTIGVSTPLQNNSISLNQSQACANDIVTIFGSVPSGAGTIVYKWEYSIDGMNWDTAPGINYNQNYNWIATTGTYFRRVILGGGCSDTSNVIHVDVIQITNQISTNDSIYCPNDTILPIQGNSVAGYQYQWQVNSGSGWINAGANAPDYTPAYFTNHLAVRRLVNFNGCSDTSGIINLFSTSALSSNFIQIDSTDTVKQFCSEAHGFIDGQISATSTEFHILWQTRFDTAQWNNLPDTTQYISFSLNDYAYHRYYYYRRIIEQNGCFDTSNVVIIDLLPPIVQSVIATNQGSSPAHLCAGNNIGIGSLSIIGGTGSYQYQWLQSTDSVNWTNAFGVNNLQYFNTPALFDSMTYVRVVTSGVCVDTSNIYTILVSTLPSNTIACDNINICQGDSMSPLYETTPTTGFGLTYQWQWMNNGTWENISGAVNANYTPFFEAGYRAFRRIITLNNCTSISNEITIVGYNSPSMTFYLVENDSLCLTPNLLAHIHTHLEGSSPWNITFLVNGNFYNFIQNQADSEYVINIDQLMYSISITQLTDASGCNANIPTDSIVIYGFNLINANALSMELCASSATMQASNPSPGVGTWILPTELTTNDIHNPNAQVFASAYGTYTAIWEVVNGPCIDTNHVSLSFFEQPQVPDAGIDIKLTENHPIVLQASPPSAGIGTWSVISGNAVFSDINNPTSTVSSFNEGINILRWTIVNGNCPIVFDDITIELKNIFIPEGFSPNNDGKNDFFVIQGINESDNYEIYIFNRWGNTVYNKLPYSNSWDGKDNNGNPLPDDTYFYLLKKNDKLIKDGYVVLKR